MNCYMYIIITRLTCSDLRYPCVRGPLRFREARRSLPVSLPSLLPRHVVCLDTACLCGCVVVPWAVAAVLIVALVPRSFLRSMCVSDEIEERILLKIGMTLAV